MSDQTGQKRKETLRELLERKGAPIASPDHRIYQVGTLIAVPGSQLIARRAKERAEQRKRASIESMELNHQRDEQ